MSRAQSPGYPSAPLQKALNQIEKIFQADRRNPIDRDTAAKHIGYSGSSGAADKAVATLAHYALVERAGKGQVQVTQLAVDILHPESEGARKNALKQAAYSPNIFKEIKARFPDRPSEDALKSWLMRESFLDRAINPVTRAFLETERFLEQEKAFESDSPSLGNDANVVPEDSEVSIPKDVTAAAKIGDFVQWEANGVLQFKEPQRVRWISDDGDWLAVEGSNTGIPMSEVTVEARKPADIVIPPAVSQPSARLAENSEAATDYQISKHGKKLSFTGIANGSDGVGKLIAELELYKKMIEMVED